MEERRFRSQRSITKADAEMACRELDKHIMTTSNALSKLIGEKEAVNGHLIEIKKSLAKKEISEGEEAYRDALIERVITEETEKVSFSRRCEQGLEGLGEVWPRLGQGDFGVSPRKNGGH